jgi:hypothetical protein
MIQMLSTSHPYYGLTDPERRKKARNEDYTRKIEVIRVIETSGDGKDERVLLRGGRRATRSRTEEGEWTYQLG